MTIENAFAVAIVYAVALVQVSRRTMAQSGQILGPVQLFAGVLCAALVPSLSVYMLHFHPHWTLGIGASSTLAQILVEYGFWLSIVSAVALFGIAAIAYYISARLTLAGRRFVGLLPLALAAALVLVFVLRGKVGGRFSGDDSPPAIVATAVIVALLGASLIAVRKFDTSGEQ